ncbi:MAG TPA: potassium-transporting ATPase subunit KdpB [Terriglobales bacterium]
MSQLRPRRLFDPQLAARALRSALGKLNPVSLVRNPVMFVVEVGAALTTGLLVAALLGRRPEAGFDLQIALWLWFTVLFANFAEAMAEARGKAQADSLRRTRSDAPARRRDSRGRVEMVAGAELRVGDVVEVQAGDLIPGDGEVIEGIATVDESVITGESAPVIRESGGDRSAVTGGTRVLSDALAIRITSNPGETFLDRMIALVEGAQRQKAPNEIALNILISGLTLIFLLAVATLLPMARFSVAQAGAGAAPSLAVLIALLVCLIPTTIGGLLSAIGIAGMDRVMQHNVLALSGKAVEAAGDIDTLLMDKTGTITIGNREAVEFVAVEGVSEAELADAAQLSSLADETPEGRSVVVLAKEKYGLRGRHLPEEEVEFIAFSAYTRMSGVDLVAAARRHPGQSGRPLPGSEATALSDRRERPKSGVEYPHGRRLRKGATAAVAAFVAGNGGTVSEAALEVSDRIARGGGTPLAVADGGRLLGFIHLKDIVKGGMHDRIVQLGEMGIRTVMITGDNPLTAAAIAAEAGVSDFLAQATPKDKLEYIRREQAAGRLVAMTGDGTNDAPALAQADVGLAMNSGTPAAKEAGNMVDLDSNPTKLIEVVAIGKQLLITRGALTTFSLANDVAKYFAILPAMFMVTYPSLQAFNIMRLHTPQSAVLSAVIFNALIIIALVPLALRGVKYRPAGAASLLRRNLLVYGLGGILAPFPCIWAIDQLVHALRLA